MPFKAKPAEERYLVRCYSLPPQIEAAVRRAAAAAGRPRSQVVAAALAVYLSPYLEEA